MKRVINSHLIISTSSGSELIIDLMKFGEIPAGKECHDGEVLD